jgi:acetyltransferase-like isoleucine patch superfamily enzyme
MELKRILKLWFFRLKLIRKKVTFCYGASIAWHSSFEGCNTIGNYTQFIGELGFGSYIANNSTIWGKIGRYCSIASDVKVLAGTHPLSPFVSTSPVFYSLLKQCNITFANNQHFEEFLYADKVNKHTLIIGNDVWIGTGAIIIGGLTIGDGAVILANATVTKDIPPYTIVGGVPGKELGKRFDDETIDFLLEFKWWNKSREWLKNNSDFFLNIERFKKEFKN